MIKKLKFYTAILLARAAYTGIKFLNISSGTSFAGMAALKICPDFLSYCRKYIKNKIITVSGTNGKTTTSGLIAHILETVRQDVIHNLQGANMLTGIANMFALGIKFFKCFDYAVIETDEGYLAKLYDFIKSDYLIVTNLFRDQLDRYGELAKTAALIQNAVDKNENLALIVNADDPLAANFGRCKKAVYYGFENIEYAKSYEQSNTPVENFNCPCGKHLQYSKRFYAQQGHYYCDCGFKRPVCNYAADIKIYDDYSVMNVHHAGTDFEFTIRLKGLYNAYNALAAIAFSVENGLNQAEIQKAFDTYKAVFGRAEKRMINGHPTIIQLIKNPTGAGEVLKTVDLKSNIIIAINDNYADGRDISWLWDSDFEQLQNAEKPIITSGIRAYDMAVRLKYAGIPQEKIIVEHSLRKAIDMVSKSSDNEPVTILPSYTALLQLNREKIHKQKGKKCY